MQKTYPLKKPGSHLLIRLCSIVALASSLLLSNRTAAKFRFERSDSDTAEKKVDYLEQLYFSGNDKEQLDQDILIAIQDIQGKQPTNALAKQVTFLLEVQPKISEIGNTCDALDLLAVGIYNIDAAEAAQQGVKMPSNKAKAKSVDAVAALGKLSNSAYNTSSSATGLAWSSIIYSNGKYTSVASKASKVASAAGKAGAIAGAAGQAAKTGKDIIDFGKGLGLGGGKKKKACDDVPEKVIALGEHKALLPAEVKPESQAQQPVIAAPVPATGAAKLTIKNITYPQMNTIKPSIEKIAGVITVSVVGFGENIAVISVASGMKTDELANKILEANKAMNLEVAGLSPQEITLIKK